MFNYLYFIFCHDSLDFLMI